MGLRYPEYLFSPFEWYGSRGGAATRIAPPNEITLRLLGRRALAVLRAVDHEGEVLESFVTKKRDRKAALRFLKKAMKRYGRPEVIVTDRLRSYRAAMREIGKKARQVTERWLNNRAENSHRPFRRRERAMAKLRSPATLQKFAAVQASVHNHFNQERHPYSRKNFKLNRSAARAEWRKLSAARGARMAGFRRPVRFSLTPPCRALIQVKGAPRLPANLSFRNHPA